MTSARSTSGTALAILVIIGSAATLGYHHRDQFASAVEEAAASPEEAAYFACRAERFEGIDGMVSERAISSEQAELFKSRADALCRDLAKSAPLVPQ